MSSSVVPQCGIRSRNGYSWCILEPGHDGDWHSSGLATFTAPAHDEEHHARQRARKEADHG